MSFTDHFRRLDEDAPIDLRFLADLGKALRARLRRAGLWEQSPALLGYDDVGWKALLEGDAPEPVVDCYLAAVVRRYDSLRDQLASKGNIDGLILLNIDRFLLARQKANDPAGYAVFKNLEASVEALAASAELTLEGRVGGKVRNATLARFPGGDSPAEVPLLERACAADPAWEHALPRQVKQGAGAQRLLVGCLRALPPAGVVAFLVGDLVGLLKRRAAEAHARRTRPADHELARAEAAGEAVGELIRTARPERGYSESGESLAALGGRLLRAIEDEPGLQGRTRAGLLSLARELLHAAEGDDAVPAWAELARRLGVSRTTLWDHVERLRALASRLPGTG